MSVEDGIREHDGGAARRGTHRAGLRRADGEARQPLGSVVGVGGLLFSPLATLYLTPVFYTCMSSVQEMARRWKQRRTKSGELVQRFRGYAQFLLAGKQLSEHN